MVKTKTGEKLPSIFSLLRSGPRPLGPKEIDGLLVSPGKASLLLTDHDYWLSAQV